MNRVYYELADVARERAGSGGGAVFAIGAGVAVAVAIGAGAFLAGHPRLGMELNLFPAAIFGSMFVTISFHVIRILGRNKDLRRLHRDWGEWRLAGIAPSRVAWVFARRGVLWGGLVAVWVICAIMASVASFGPFHHSHFARLAIVLLPGFVDIVFILVGGVILDVAQWPKRHHLFHRILAQFAFGMCGVVPFTGGLLFLMLISSTPIRDPMGVVFVSFVISSVIRMIYIGQQWERAIRMLDDEISRPFW